MLLIAVVTAPLLTLRVALAEAFYYVPRLDALDEIPAPPLFTPVK
jgi:hypothetical protein